MMPCVPSHTAMSPWSTSGRMMGCTAIVIGLRAAYDAAFGSKQSETFKTRSHAAAGKGMGDQHFTKACMCGPRHHGFCSPDCLSIVLHRLPSSLLNVPCIACVRSFAKALLRSKCPGAEDGCEGQGAMVLDNDALPLFANQILTVTPENTAAGRWKEIGIDRDFFSKANIESMVPFLFYCKWPPDRTRVTTHPTAPPPP